MTQGEDSLEIILVDDGSTDGSGMICDRYWGAYPSCIKVVHKTNEGPLAARLDAIAMASGEYVMFLDSDDIFLSGIFDRLRTLISASDSDMIMFNHVRLTANRVVAQDPLYPDGSVFEGASLKALCEDALATTALNALWQKCVRRELLEHVETLRAYQNLVLGEDKLLVIHMLSRARRVSYSTDRLYGYRVSEKSLSHALGLRHYQDMSIVFSETEKQALSWQLPEVLPTCQLNRVEFGISCLYATARRVLQREESKGEFFRLAQCVKDDALFWDAYVAQEAHVGKHKRAACWMLRSGWFQALFDLFNMQIRMKQRQ